MSEQAAVSSFFIWVFALVLGVPLLVVLMTEAIERLARHHPGLSKVVALFRNVVLPLLVVRLICQFVLGMAPTDPLVVALETAFWLALLYALLRLLNLFVEGLGGAHKAAAADTTPGSQTHAETAKSSSLQLPRVWGEVLRLLIITGIGLYLLNIIWGVALSQVFVVLGGASIVVAFALQDTLNGLSAGMLLAFEKPFEVGHWIRYGNYEGKIIEMNWRSVRLLTRERDVIVIPNLQLSKELVVNFTVVDPLHAEMVRVSFPADYPPNQIRQLLMETALATPGVVPVPKPHVRVQEYQYDKAAIEYEIKLFVKEFARTEFIRDELLTRIYYAARRHKLATPLTTALLLQRDDSELLPEDDHTLILRYLSEVPFLADLPEPRREQLAQGTLLHHYGVEELLVQPGGCFTGLYILLAGQVELYARDAAGKTLPILTIGPGDILGETVLLRNEPSPYTAAVRDDLLVLFIQRNTLVEVVESNLRLAKEMNRFIEQRRKLVTLALSGGAAAPPVARHGNGAAQ